MKLGIRILIVAIWSVCLWPGSDPLNGQDPVAENILFIAVDDLKPKLGCYGDTLVQTPYIDALAQGGLVFQKAYCQQAVCAPSRASLLTSRYPDQTGVLDLQTQLRTASPGIITLPEYLRDYGFETAATGKIFDSRSVDKQLDAPSWSIPYLQPYQKRFYDPGFGRPSYFYASQQAKDTIEVLTGEALASGEAVLPYIQQRFWPSVENADVSSDSYVDGAIANAGMELLGELAGKSKPFFLAVGFHRPHLPFAAPRTFWERYDRNQFNLAGFREQANNSPSLAYHNFGELRAYSDIPQSGELSPEKQLELIHGYYAATSYIDSLIGSLLNRLEALGLSENTVVVLWGDHGWHLGDHNLWCKHSNFEQATRVPLIISYPGQKGSGRVSSAMVELTDIAPTLCELTGVPVPVAFEGESLLPLFTNPDTALRKGAFSQYPRGNRMGYTLRTGRYRYTRWENSNGSLYAAELYDYLSDPQETISLSGMASYKDLEADLDSLVRERISIPSTQERIRFSISHVLENEKPAAVRGAHVSFAGQTRETNTDGSTMFTHVPGTYSYSVLAEGFKQMTGVARVSADTTIHLQLDPLHRIRVEVHDLYTGLSLQAANIEIPGEVLRTDEYGSAMFRSVDDTISLNIQLDHYDGLSDTLVIKSDTTLQYLMEPLRADVRLWIREGEVPLKDATVQLNEDLVVTQSMGLAKFPSLPNKISYTYGVTKDGYTDAGGELLLFGDTTLHIQMEKIESGIRDGTGDFSFKLWPQPYQNTLSWSTPLICPDIRIKIIGMNGTLWFEKSYKNLNTGQIQIGFLPPGIYMVTFSSATYHTHKRILKTDTPIK